VREKGKRRRVYSHELEKIDDVLTSCLLVPEHNDVIRRDLQVVDEKFPHAVDVAQSAGDAADRRASIILDSDQKRPHILGHGSGSTRTVRL
jgi:tRNA A37 threonylcarbamoyladenosine synthetase subunit TsaC/SUA5/YrdC